MKSRELKALEKSGAKILVIKSHLNLPVHAANSHSHQRQTFRRAKPAKANSRGGQMRVVELSGGGGACLGTFAVLLVLLNHRASLFIFICCCVYSCLVSLARVSPLAHIHSLLTRCSPHWRQWGRAWLPARLRREGRRSVSCFVCIIIIVMAECCWLLVLRGCCCCWERRAACDLEFKSYSFAFC